MSDTLLLKAAVAITLLCLPYVCPAVPAVAVCVLVIVLLWGPLRPSLGKKEEHLKAGDADTVLRDLSGCHSSSSVRYRHSMGHPASHHLSSPLQHQVREPLRNVTNMHLSTPIHQKESAKTTHSQSLTCAIPSTPARRISTLLDAGVNTTPSLGWHPHSDDARRQLLELLQDVELRERQIIVVMHGESMAQFQFYWASSLEALMRQAGSSGDGMDIALSTTEGTPPTLRHHSSGRRNSLLITPQRLSARYTPYSKKLSQAETPGPHPEDIRMVAGMDMSICFLLSNAEAKSRAAENNKAQCLSSQIQFLQQWEANVRSQMDEQQLAELQGIMVNESASRHTIRTQQSDRVQQASLMKAHQAATTQICEIMAMLQSAWEQSKAHETLLENVTREYYKAAERYARTQLHSEAQQQQSLAEAALRERRLVEEMENSLRSIIHPMSEDMFCD